MAGRPGDARAPLPARPPAELHRRLSPIDRTADRPVQVFGRRDSRDTQKALRFFKERRVPVAFVDLAQRPIAPAELRRFATRFGAAALFDESTRAYRDQGLAYVRMSDEEAFERVLREQALLRLPLVRAGSDVSVGVDEHAWRALLAVAG